MLPGNKIQYIHLKPCYWRKGMSSSPPGYSNNLLWNWARLWWVRWPVLSGVALAPVLQQQWPVPLHKDACHVPYGTGVITVRGSAGGEICGQWVLCLHSWECECVEVMWGMEGGDGWRDMWTSSLPSLVGMWVCGGDVKDGRVVMGGEICEDEFFAFTRGNVSVEVKWEGCEDGRVVMGGEGLLLYSKCVLLLRALALCFFHLSILLT